MLRRHDSVGRLIVLITGLLTTAVVPAAPADLDLGFGVGGTIAIPIASFPIVPGHLAVLQPDGKLLVAATTLQAPQMKRVWLILRYMPDGSLDQAFGTNGSTVVSLSGGAADDDPRGGIALLPDGRFVVAGESYFTDCRDCFYGNTLGQVARFNADGTLDQSFGTKGVSTEPSGFNSVAIQDDGKILLGTNVRFVGFQLARLNGDGSSDVGFAPTIACPFGSQGTFRLATDGMIVIAAVDAINNFCVSRLNADGTLDATFGSQGTELVTAGTNDHLGDFFVDAGGAITIAASTTTGGTLFRLTPAGGRDIQFEVDASSAVGAFGDLGAVAGDCFNRTIVAGPPSNGGGNFLTARFLADGSADASFAPPNRLRQTNISALPLQLLVRPNGRIIVLALADNELDVVQYQGDLPCNVLTAVEYYHTAWNYYFETAFLDEIAALDGGAFGGVWQRTGQTFNVWPQPNASSQKTCRYFSTAFAPKSSHFYSPYPAECAVLKTNPDWEFEAIAFYIQLPDPSGLCSVGTVPLYRLYNNGMGGAPNHRYTTSMATFNQMVAQAWVFEGNAITKVFACVPQ